MEQTFKDKLYIERDQLSGRLDKLNNFLVSDKFKELTFNHQNLLVDQQYYMSKYLDILNKRIKLYE